MNGAESGAYVEIKILNVRPLWPCTTQMDPPLQLGGVACTTSPDGNVSRGRTGVSRVRI